MAPNEGAPTTPTSFVSPEVFSCCRLAVSVDARAAVSKACNQAAGAACSESDSGRSGCVAAVAGCVAAVALAGTPSSAFAPVFARALDVTGAEDIGAVSWGLLRSVLSSVLPCVLSSVLSCGLLAGFESPSEALAGECKNGEGNHL